MKELYIKLFVASLGCPKNTVDTELMIGYIKKVVGVEIVSVMDDADIILINTCGFITPAKEESIDVIMQAITIKKTKNVKIVVAGCLYERYKEELKKELPEIDCFVGVYELKEIAKCLFNKTVDFQKPYTHREHITPKHIGYVKIAEGCSNGCSFCAIPLIKGGFKSREKKELIDEARFLSQSGVKELYVIAQDTTAYMFDKNRHNELVKLLENIEGVDGIEWIRLMYTYPTHINDELLELISTSSKILSYIDVPFQHINNRILQSMNRKYKKSDIIGLVERLKYKNITIRSTFIVGYPTETEKEFDELCDFVEQYELDWVGFFEYYHEEDTQAFKLKDLNESIKRERLATIEDIQRNVYEKKHRNFLGRECKAIIDGISEELPGFVESRLMRSAHEIDGIVFVKNDNLNIGDIVNIKLIDTINSTDFIGIVK